MFGGNVVILLLFLINSIFRGAGDAAISMRSLWIANACNLVLDPLLIFGLGPFPELGLDGRRGRDHGGTRDRRPVPVPPAGRRAGSASTSTAPPARRTRRCSRSLVRLSGAGDAPDPHQHHELDRPRPGRVDVRRARRSPATRSGSAIVIFAILPAWGLSNAAATMVGQALGAESPIARRRSVWKAGCVQRLLPRRARARLRDRARRSSSGVHRRSGGAAPRDQLPADRQRGIPVLCLWHRADERVQRRRRHVDADAPQPRAASGSSRSRSRGRSRTPRASARTAPSSRSPSRSPRSRVVCALLFRRGRWKTRAL